MNRRDFFHAGAAGLALTAASEGAAAAWQNPKQPRVGLIGCGWYGKCDLLRLLQVAPVEVVALCDVDRNMLTDAEGLDARHWCLLIPHPALRGMVR